MDLLPIFKLIYYIWKVNNLKAAIILSEEVVTNRVFVVFHM